MKKNRARIVPVVKEFPADLLTPVSAYLRLSSNQKQSFLFESVEGGERLGRYSFLGVDPFECLFIQDGELRVQREGGRLETIPGNPLREIGNYLSRFKSDPHPELPPFTGGAVGYVAYEAARYLERIPTAATEAGPFEAYFMLFKTVVAFDHVRRRVLLIHNIFLDEESLTDGQRAAERALDSLREILGKASAREVPLSLAGSAATPELNLRGQLGEARYSSAVGRIKEAIRSGDIFQCVLSEEFRWELSTDPFLIYRTLRSQSPAPYLFYLSTGSETLLGASPEMLVRVSDGIVQSCPIAGTRPRGKTPLEDKKFERQMCASVKERAEHLMLVDLGRNDIGRTAQPGSVRVVDFMKVQRFSHVMHLVSLVEGKLARGRTAWDAFCACFPAGTLSGAPKIRAMEIIAELEASRRGPYGGAIVYSDFSGRLDSCITIRSLYIRDGVARLRAGAGIVADSQAAREYEEVRNKTKSLRQAVALSGAAK